MEQGCTKTLDCDRQPLENERPFWALSRHFTYLAANIIIIMFRPTGTKPQAEILKLNNVNGCNDLSFGDYSILEGDRIPPLKSHGQALEEELCFPGVLSDNRDAPANLLRHFYGCRETSVASVYSKPCIEMFIFNSKSH